MASLECLRSRSDHEDLRAMSALLAVFVRSKNIYNFGKYLLTSGGSCGVQHRDGSTVKVRGGGGGGGGGGVAHPT